MFEMDGVFLSLADFWLIWMAEKNYSPSKVFIGYALLFPSVPTFIFINDSCMNGISFFRTHSWVMSVCPESEDQA